MVASMLGMRNFSSKRRESTNITDSFPHGGVTGFQGYTPLTVERTPFLHRVYPLSSPDSSMTVGDAIRGTLVASCRRHPSAVSPPGPRRDSLLPQSLS